MFTQRKAIKQLQHTSKLINLKSIISREKHITEEYIQYYSFYTNLKIMQKYIIIRFIVHTLRYEK